MRDPLSEAFYAALGIAFALITATAVLGFFETPPYEPPPLECEP